MWIDGGRLAAIDQALEHGPSEVDRLLADVLAGADTQRDVLSVCPGCRGDLVRQPLGATGVYASRCPAGHGAWAPDAALHALQRFVETHASAEARARRRVRLLTRVFLVLLAAAPIVVVAAGGSGAWRDGVGTLVQWHQDRSVSPTHWPDRGWMLPGDVPTKGSVIDVHAELVYVDGLVRLLKTGATNRLNIDGALGTRRDAREYTALYETYRGRQQRVLADLRALPAPARLAEIHGRVVRAAEAQIVFYGAWTEARAKDPAIDLARMLPHPAARQSNEELLGAWEGLQRTYRLDRETWEVLYRTLCAFDVI
jgi:hypothetical protein